MAGLMWADEERWLVAGTGADVKGDRGKVAGERASVGRVKVGRGCGCPRGGGCSPSWRRER